MKKTYKAPKYKTIDLTGEEMIAQSISSQDLDGTSYGGNTSSLDLPDGGDVKGVSHMNLWDDEW